MKRHISILMTLTALFPFAAWSATDTSTGAASAPLVVPADVKLSQPARDVVKMVASGISDDVVKAYIANTPAAFNLSADNIIHMQGVGVSGTVTSAMLTHDRTARDQMAAAPPPVSASQTTQPQMPYPAEEAAPPAQPANTVSVYTIPPDTATYYSELQPYGSWCYLADYGWCWQPRIGLGYYPWGLLRGGRWWNCPGRGWCWFPQSHFRGTTGLFAGNRGFGINHGFATTRGFNTGRSGFNRGVSFASNRSVSTTHFGGGFHSSSFGMSHSSGGHFSGGHSSGHSFGGGSRSGGGHR